MGHAGYLRLRRYKVHLLSKKEHEEGRVKRAAVVAAIIIVAFTLSYIGKQTLSTSEGLLTPIHSETDPQPRPLRAVHRIISMTPSITETLFTLGLGEKVVGVTRYCEYPPEAKKKMAVGGYHDANYEAIMGLAPDLVIMLPEQEKTRQFLEKMGIATLTINNKTIPDILGTVRTIGKRCGVEERSEKLARQMETRIERLKQKNSRLYHPRVLVSIGGYMRSGSLDTICVAGKNSFYGQIVELAGGINAYQGTLPFPDISREGMVELNPQVIIDIVVSPHYESLDNAKKESIMRQWREAASRTDAAQDNRIYLIEKDYAVIPGPRFILALEDIKKMIYPDGVDSHGLTPVSLERLRNNHLAVTPGVTTGVLKLVSCRGYP
jgi:iron complex transport system substrate-binding protein